MTKLAIEVNAVRVSRKTRGFQSLTKITPVRVDEDEDQGEAACAG